MLLAPGASYLWAFSSSPLLISWPRSQGLFAMRPPAALQPIEGHRPRPTACYAAGEDRCKATCRAFGRILAPLGTESFISSCWSQQVLHVKGPLQRMSPIIKQLSNLDLSQMLEETPSQQAPSQSCRV